jgi:ABC-type transporter Mla MlaB component
VNSEAAMPQPLVLPPELTIYGVGELRRSWLEWLAVLPPAAADAAPLHVDASAVAEVDAAGLQLLQALAHSAAREQRALAIDDPSAALAAACQALGVGGLLAAAAHLGAAA